MDKGKRIMGRKWRDIGYRGRGWNIKFVWTYAAYAHMCLFNLTWDYFLIKLRQDWVESDKLGSTKVIQGSWGWGCRAY